MKDVRKTVRLAVLAAAVILIIVGIRENGFREVMSRAVMICLDCIGIG
ncbi:MAG: hypothetical protein II800_10510 [Lachnospiraceae bacterium]|nr:hypothetical protein [Lachnospiraceae bacterium]